MKKILHSALAAALLLAAGTAQAQITFGPKVGINVASLKETLSDNAKKDDDAEEQDFKSAIGASFGLMMNARFGNISIQPALTYSMKGAKIDEDETRTNTSSGFTTTTKSKGTANINLGYLDIPINFVYTTGGDQGFQVFAGPYVGVGIGGKYKGDYETTITTTGFGVNTTTTDKGDFDYEVEFNGSPSNSEAEDAFKDEKFLVSGLDYGVNAGVGYLINNFQIQAGYGFGLGNLEPKYQDEDDADRGSLKNRVISVTAAYHFGGK